MPGARLEHSYTVRGPYSIWTSYGTYRVFDLICLGRELKSHFPQKFTVKLIKNIISMMNIYFTTYLRQKCFE